MITNEFLILWVQMYKTNPMTIEKLGRTSFETDLRVEDKINEIICHLNSQIMNRESEPVPLQDKPCFWCIRFRAGADNNPCSAHMKDHGNK